MNLLRFEKCILFLKLIHLINSFCVKVPKTSYVDHLLIRTGVLEPGKNEDIILTVNTRDINVYNITDRDIEYLEKITDVAYYGYGNEKVTNCSYRNSKYTKTFDLNLNFSRLLTKMGIENMVIKPYKLNLYTEGSFFNVHRDTNMPGLIGTLILILPTNYTGGEICFGDFHPEATMKKDELRFIYFDFDLEHSINKVKSGHRISLAYNVLDPFFSKPSIEPKVHFKEMPEEVYQNLLRDAIEFCKDKKNILFGQDKYRNDIFYKLLEDLKKQFEVIPVAVKPSSYIPRRRNFSVIKKVYALNKSNPEGVYDKSQARRNLAYFSHCLYKVNDTLFPRLSYLKEHSMDMVQAVGNEPWDEHYTIECYLGYLINPQGKIQIPKKDSFGEYEDDSGEAEETDTDE